MHNKKEQMSCVLPCVDILFLEEKCLNLEKYLKHDNSLDIDKFDLISELNILRKIIGLENDKPIDILNYIKIINSFSNVYITYRIMLIILVSVVLAEMSLSNLKIINTYYHVSRKLNKLVILSIEKEMLKKFNYDNLINNLHKKMLEK